MTPLLLSAQFLVLGMLGALVALYVWITYRAEDDK
jgi:hypothetical protein